VDQEPADKLNGTDGDLFYSIVFSILIPEAHHTIFEGCDAAVGNSDPVSVAAQVLKDVFRLFNGLPDTDHPLVFIEFVFKVFISPIHIDLTIAHSPCEETDELASKDH